MQIVHQWLPKISSPSMAQVPLLDIKDMNRLVHQLSPAAPEFDTRAANDLRLESDILLMRDVSKPEKVVSKTQTLRSPIIAMAFVFVMHLPQRVCAHIENVVVDETYRGKGIGMQMMQCIENWALMSGVTRLQLSSSKPSAQVMYRKLGFTNPATLLFRKNL